MILLSINREQTYSFDDLIEQLRESLVHIETLSDSLNLRDSNSPKIMILKNRLKDLMELVSLLGDFQYVDANLKHEKIMEIQNDLLILTNRIHGISAEIDLTLAIVTNFLLNHLCSTAASTPHSQVIGVANVLAQVLSSEHTKPELPEMENTETQSQFFQNFILTFNYLLTNAGLYASPIISLPHISISALGGWAETAISYFAELDLFIDRYFRPQDFIQLDKLADSIIPFDSTKDILASYLFANEFYVALAAKADLLSGLKFPGHLIGGENKSFSSVESNTLILCDAIDASCEKITQIIDNLKSLYDLGKINRNENPYTDKELNQILTEATAWKIISNLGRSTLTLLKAQSDYYSDSDATENFTEFLDSKNLNLRQQLYSISDSLQTIMKSVHGSSSVDMNEFAITSEFVRFRQYLEYLLHCAALLQLFYRDTDLVRDIYREYYSLFHKPNVETNPVATLILGQLFCFGGYSTKNRELILEGLSMLEDIEPHVQFQTHHFVHIKLLKTLFQSYLLDDMPDQMAQKINEEITTIIKNHIVTPESKLYQKLLIYQGLLQIYEESGVFMVNLGERLIPFDIFSWLMSIGAQYEIPFLPLNTALDNLDEG